MYIVMMFLNDDGRLQSKEQWFKIFSTFSEMPFPEISAEKKEIYIEIFCSCFCHVVALGSVKYSLLVILASKYVLTN